MKKPGAYIVWVGNKTFRYHTLEAAQRRADQARQEGKHFVIATKALRHTVFSIPR